MSKIGRLPMEGCRVYTTEEVLDIIQSNTRDEYNWIGEGKWVRVDTYSQIKEEGPWVLDPDPNEPWEDD